MKSIVILLNLLCVILLSSCKGDIKAGKDKLAYYTNASLNSDTLGHPINKERYTGLTTRNSSPAQTINVGETDPNEVVSFAQTLIGTPYVYGSTDPLVGFDCSGFITFVFNHFNIRVPRSSSQFKNVGETVSQAEAQPGDLILFTSPSFDNANSKDVGHMGLITTNSNGVISFVHSTSGKAMAVTLTPLNEHYQKRFLRICRIFPTEF